MPRIHEIVTKYQLEPKKCIMKGKTVLLETENGRVAIKEKTRDINTKILTYLDSRSFPYYPKIIKDDGEYIVTEGIEEVDMPLDQKMMDMIDLLALLHNKTTHYKEVDLDDYKKIYEDISNNIVYLKSYYEDYLSVFTSHVFMSPSEYLFSRNATKIFTSLEFAKNELESWYELVKEKRKQRLVVLHNHLDLSHFIKNKNPYFISWEKAKIGIPIFDFYKLYKKHGIDFEFGELLKRYEQHYPLLEEERKLLFILMSLPSKVEFHDNLYDDCIVVSRFIDELYKSEMIISPYYTEQTK